MKTRKTGNIICILILLLAISAGLAFCEENTCTVEIVQLTGKADVLKELGSNGWIPAKAGMCLDVGDIFKTKENSRALLTMHWKKDIATIAIAVKGDSELRITDIQYREKTGTYKILLDLAVGKILIKARHFDPTTSDFEIKTPSTIVDVKGAIFSIEVEPSED